MGRMYNFYDTSQIDILKADETNYHLNATHLCGGFLDG